MSTVVPPTFRLFPDTKPPRDPLVMPAWVADSTDDALGQAPTVSAVPRWVTHGLGRVRHWASMLVPYAAVVFQGDWACAHDPDAPE
jgi:hypothetical protein